MSDSKQRPEPTPTHYQAHSAGMPVPLAHASPPQGGDCTRFTSSRFVKAHDVSAIRVLSESGTGSDCSNEALYYLTRHERTERM
ncbi:MAG: hypothetical protein OXG15_07890 [Gammaproteobacteria bacterium]|nr:hypothetical protein [Gammaproteobacteria bacterium]